MTHTFVMDDSFHAVMKCLRETREEYDRIIQPCANTQQIKNTEINLEIKSKTKYIPANVITKNEITHLINEIDIDLLYTEINNWYFFIEKCGIYNTKSNKDHICSVSCRMSQIFEEIRNVESETSHNPARTNKTNIPNILYLWDTKYAHVIQKMTILKYLNPENACYTAILSLSKRHNIYGCLFSGNVHFCHPISYMRENTCKNTCIIDSITGVATCSYSGMRIKKIDDIFTPDKNLSFTKTFMPQKKHFTQSLSETPIVHKEPNVLFPGISGNNTNPTSTNNADNAHSISKEKQHQSKNIYVHNLGSHIKFSYQGIYTTEKIVKEIAKFYYCLKNTCLSLYWYQTCIVNDTFEEFSEFAFDKKFEKYWKTLYIIIPKIYNMYQSYSHAHDYTGKKSVVRKCNIPSLIMGLCGLISNGMMIYGCPVIIQMPEKEICLKMSCIDMLSWNETTFRSLFEQKISHQVSSKTDKTHLNSSGSSSSNSFDSSSSDSQDIFLNGEDNENQSHIQTSNNTLIQTYKHLISSLKSFTKAKRDEKFTYFCDAVKNKSGDFSYTTSFNNGTKTITDVCHECNMDPKTMQKLFYS